MQSGALWDMHHPYRIMGEAPETTVQNLGAYIKYIHVKDSVMTENGVEYRMMGEGDLPVDEMVFALRSINYDGYTLAGMGQTLGTGFERRWYCIPAFYQLYGTLPAQTGEPSPAV